MEAVSDSYLRLEPSSSLLSGSDTQIEEDRAVLAWAGLLQLRCPTTETHSLRAGALAVQLARAMGLSEERVRMVWRGAVLHDIGKIGVPDRILLKEGPLDAKERRVMEEHPCTAYMHLRSVDFLRPSLSIPLFHHERWDGGGYPFGLKRDAIPEHARLFAVIDVFDALTSERPYRPAWETDRALRFIEEGTGSHFDPAVVDKFLAQSHALGQF